ncbi:SyrB2 transcriptional regulator [Stappia aggregata IAM 12614]|uniref:SyrB2 transcriptional regulator n=1 Tax=Roseibium aggregatum (strain ATCC 25650 / DSM 13394 / JCM 20685 / NBRC 16684 / NCIMB 2208 / IAM 12614 / B1) TaxID=384765 RepID=A0P0S6_ROSAI|nr:transposase [Roseibium aggregatum]EAV41390.1 SyrB2 transcriptional regulator [Stappia aggregata IAM 12614] [Roseibium aggregatum IAM 12614]
MTDEQAPRQLQPTNVSEDSDTKLTSQRPVPSGRRGNSVTRNASTKAGTRQRYSKKERAAKIAQIETRLSESLNIKAAIKEAGISEQTYYRWKRSATPQEKPEKLASQSKVEKKASSELETLEDLVALEAENIRLRTQLAEKLRAENAELRKRLGME